MDRFAKEYFKSMKRNQDRNKTIAILALVLLIMFMPVLFLLLNGPAKIAEMRTPKNPVDIDSESLVHELDQGVSDVIGTEAEPSLVGSDTTIEDIVRISELQTLEYSYDAICRVEDNGETVYYIAYESTVYLGIDTSRIGFAYGDDDNKVITIILPPVEVLDTNVDAGSFDYIFIDPRYDNSAASVTAQQFCEEDVADKISEDETMYASARDNTEAEIRALTEPMVEQFYPDYELVIVWGS